MLRVADRHPLRHTRRGRGSAPAAAGPPLWPADSPPDHQQLLEFCIAHQRRLGLSTEQPPRRAVRDDFRDLCQTAWWVHTDISIEQPHTRQLRLGVRLDADGRVCDWQAIIRFCERDSAGLRVTRSFDVALGDPAGPDVAQTASDWMRYDWQTGHVDPDWDPDAIVPSDRPAQLTHAHLAAAISRRFMGSGADSHRA